MRVAALLTCHNRREKTVGCLRALRAQVLPGWNPWAESEKLKVESGNLECPLASSTEVSAISQQFCSAGAPVASPAIPSSFPENDKALPLGCSTFSLKVFLVDDGSTDGTADAVRTVWPDASILAESGSRFWCGGMRLAWAEAAKADPDYYLLLNDDTVLFPSALATLLEVARCPESLLIAVGAILDPETGFKNYGGTSESPMPFPPPDGRPQECLLFNANCVLVPRAVFNSIGMFHVAYTHSMGDMDYSHEARRHGIKLLEAPRAVGSCERNPNVGTWQDTSLSRRKRLRLLNSPKGLPLREWLIFCRRNCGGQWVRYFLSPLLRILSGR